MTVLEAFTSRDEFGRAVWILALLALKRGDRDLADDLFELDQIERRPGRSVELEACYGFGALHHVVDGQELRAWASASAAVMDDPDLLLALDGLARRRVSH